MSVFAYTALNKEGRSTSGTLTAGSRADALAEMSRKGLHPVRIDEARDEAAARKATASANRAAASQKVGHKIVESFTRELANLLAGGVPLARSLSLLKRETTNAAAKQQWGQIHDDVVGGTSLADALAKFPRSFSTVYIAMVRAGEAGGFLDVVLGQISDFRAREQDLKGKVKAAMIYPCILAIVAVFVLIGMLTFFIPRFSTIFSDLGANLPLITRFILAISHGVENYWLYGGIGIVLAIFILQRAMTTDAGRRNLEIVMLSTPVVGKIVANFALVRFARMLGTLVGAGVPLIASLRVAREAIGNQTLADTVYHAIEQVQRGESLSKALSTGQRLFPPSVVEMVAIAEETGRLDKELLRLSSAYEADLDRQLRMLVSIAEPAMLFVIAAVIGTIVIGMLLPIFTLQDLIHN